MTNVVVTKLNFNELKLNDKKLFDEFFSKFPQDISELTFTNLFMWRNCYNFNYTFLEDFLILIARPLNSEPYAYMPLGNYGDKGKFIQVLNTLKEYFQSNGWKFILRKLDINHKNILEEYGIDFNFSEDRDNSDYVYSTEKLRSLKGKKYNAKRNHINRFKKEHEYVYEKITGENIKACYEIMDEWCINKGCEKHAVMYCEKLANCEVLDNYFALGCKGCLIKVDGKYEAFTVAEMLNKETAVIHIEKANNEINGLYTLINQQFVEKELSNTVYVNREQDLGVEGLRKAKLSYHPEFLIDKFTVEIY